MFFTSLKNEFKGMLAVRDFRMRGAVCIVAIVLGIGLGNTARGNGRNMGHDPEVAMARLEALSAVIDARPGVNLGVLEQEGHTALTHMAIQPLAALGAKQQGNEIVAGLPPIAWGLLLNIPGVFVVYTATDDRIATRQAMWGAATQTMAIGVLYFTLLSRATASK
jgi:hypothetical protein